MAFAAPPTPVNQISRRAVLADARNQARSAGYTDSLLRAANGVLCSQGEHPHAAHSENSRELAAWHSSAREAGGTQIEPVGSIAPHAATLHSVLPIHDKFHSSIPRAYRQGQSVNWGRLLLEPAYPWIKETPVIELSNIFHHPDVRIFAKPESGQYSESIKGRATIFMCTKRLVQGNENVPELELRYREILENPAAEPRTLIEPTSGNTGAGIAQFVSDLNRLLINIFGEELGKLLGFRTQLIVPDTISEAKTARLESAGAKVLKIEKGYGTDDAQEYAKNRAAEDGRLILLDQYSNPFNPLAHVQTTVPEILRHVPGITHFVACKGTTGTLIGCANGFKERGANVKIIGVEPKEMFHGLEGIKNLLATARVPPVYKPALVDRTIFVDDCEAWEAWRALRCVQGVSCGISSAAAVVAALRIAHGLIANGRKGDIVVPFPDGIEHYEGSTAYQAAFPEVYKPRQAKARHGKHQATEYGFQDGTIRFSSDETTALKEIADRTRTHRGKEITFYGKGRLYGENCYIIDEMHIVDEVGSETRSTPVFDSEHARQLYTGVKDGDDEFFFEGHTHHWEHTAKGTLPSRQDEKLGYGNFAHYPQTKLLAILAVNEDGTHEIGFHTIARLADGFRKHIAELGINEWDALTGELPTARSLALGYRPTTVSNNGIG